MDAIELLKSDHDKVEGIFMQFQQGGGSQEFRQLFAQLYQELTLHSLAEENVIYPTLAQFDETAGYLKDVYKDHAEAKAAFAELAALDNTSSEWSQKMTKLMKDVQAHVQEEENEIFPRMRQRLSEQQLQMIGQEIQKAKQLSMQAVQESLPMKEIMGNLSTGMNNMPNTQAQINTTGQQFV